MSKRIILFISFLFFSSCHLAHASLVINEVMYDLSGADSTNGKSREWIEIYNPDTIDVSIDASKWRIYDGSANRTINNLANFSVLAGSYVIFAGNKDTFLLDHAGFGGVVYDTGITSLNNTGATLKILDQNLNPVDSVSYTSLQGGAGDGNSLQKISGSWVGATPTPGVANVTTTSSPAGGLPVYISFNNNNSSTQTATPSTIPTETKNKTAEDQKIKTQIVGNNFAFAGIPSTLTATALGHSKEQLHYGKYFWNFGDGDSKEVKGNNLNDLEKIYHTYFYPGTHTVTLEYYMNYYSETPDATDTMTMTVVPADISISAVGDEKDFFIELTNNTNYYADISNWVLSSNVKSFNLPKNTSIESKNKIIISPLISNFSFPDRGTLRLITPPGKTAFDYSTASMLPQTQTDKTATLIVADVSQENKIAEKVSTEVSTKQHESPAKKDSAEVPAAPLIPVENLAATVVQSDTVKNNSSSSYMPTLISLVFIGVSAGAVYFIRRKGTAFKAGDDFKILDE